MIISPNLIERIDALREIDNEPITKQAQILLEAYKEASADQRHQMDLVTICLCGYSISSIIDDWWKIKP